MKTIIKTDKAYKMVCSCIIVIMFVALFAVPCFAAGDVAGAIESTWDAAKGQIQQVTNNVIFPALDKKVRIGTEYVIDGKTYIVDGKIEGLFAHQSVTSVIIPEGITEMENNTFNSCGVDYVYIPKSLVSV